MCTCQERSRSGYRLFVSGHDLCCGPAAVYLVPDGVDSTGMRGAFLMRGNGELQVVPSLTYAAQGATGRSRCSGSPHPSSTTNFWMVSCTALAKGLHAPAQNPRQCYMGCEHWVCAHSVLESLQCLSRISAPEMHGGRCAERWQKPDPDNPGHTLAESVMAQFSFRYGVGELWLGVGVTAAWTIVMAGATFLALILLDREDPSSILKEVD